jgi:hypothetical protein
MRSAICGIAQDTPPPLIVSNPRRHNFGESPEPTVVLLLIGNRREHMPFST